jgi:hypothetical protein
MSEIVEAWGISPNGYCAVIIDDSYGYVINGDYFVKTDKENNTVYVIDTRETHTAYFLGYIEYNGDYNETINTYNVTRQTIPIKPSIIECINKLQNIINGDISDYECGFILNKLSKLKNSIKEKLKINKVEHTEPPF